MTRPVIKKVMKLDRQGDGALDMYIHIQRRPDGFAYVDTRLCGNFGINPITTAQGVMETMAATVTEFMKAAEKG